MSSNAPNGLSIVFFPRLTLAGVARHVIEAPAGHKMRILLKKLVHWRANLVIARAQLFADLRNWRDHKWELVHCGVNDAGAELKRYVEAVYGEGVVVKDLALKIEKFQGHAYAVPVRKAATTRASTAAGNQRWPYQWLLDQVIGQQYDTAGAVGSPWQLGVESNGYFCSELAAACCQAEQALDASEYVLELPAPTLLLRSKPACSWPPAELAREACLRWDECVVLSS